MDRTEKREFVATLAGVFAETSFVLVAQNKGMTVAEVSDRTSVIEQLRRHSDGETSYVEMSEALANSGVEKWVGDTAALTFTYCDRAGEHLEERRDGRADDGHVVLRRVGLHLRDHRIARGDQLADVGVELGRDERRHAGDSIQA